MARGAACRNAGMVHDGPAEGREIAFTVTILTSARRREMVCRFGSNPPDP